MKRNALDNYFRSVMHFILTILAVFIFGSELSARTYAYVVADARDGKIINSYNSRQIVHPASLTKMMTLYYFFFFGGIKLPAPGVKSQGTVFSPSLSRKAPLEKAMKKLLSPGSFRVLA